MGYKWILMYECFDDNPMDAMYEYLKSYLSDYITMDENGSLYVREDMYDVVFAITNSYAVFSEDEDEVIPTYEHCLEWKNQRLANFEFYT